MPKFYRKGIKSRKDIKRAASDQFRKRQPKSLTKTMQKLVAMRVVFDPKTRKVFDTKGLPITSSHLKAKAKNLATMFLRPHTYNQRQLVVKEGTKIRRPKGKEVTLFIKQTGFEVKKIENGVYLISRKL